MQADLLRMVTNITGNLNMPRKGNSHSFGCADFVIQHPLAQNVFFSIPENKNPEGLLCLWR